LTPQAPAPQQRLALLQIKLPAGMAPKGVRTVIPVNPLVGTGAKRAFFPPVAERPLAEILSADSAPYSKSRLYRANREWDAALAARLARPALDPAVFQFATMREQDSSKRFDSGRATVRVGRARGRV